ncbi:MAG: aspartyl protease family protein [Acidobacteriaceae bacterium]
MAAGVLLRLLASSLCLWAQQTMPGKTTKQTPIAPTPPSISWHTAGEIAIPFEYFKQHIYVMVSLNGKPGFVFMLDSGANRNILNLRTARQLGLKPRLDVQKNIGFGSGLIYTAPQQNVNVTIDSVQAARVLSVLDLSRFEMHFSHATDGMLGYPFFQRFVVKLDFQRKLLILLPADNHFYRGAGIRIGLKPSKDFVVMPVTVGTASYVYNKIDMIVDTGSNLTLMLYDRYVRSLHLDSSLTHAEPAKGYGLNGYYPMALGTIHAVRIGDAEARDVSVAYLAKDNELAPARHIPGAIGNGILQSFQTITFDVPRHRMFFELKPAPWQSGIARIYVAPR